MSKESNENKAPSTWAGGAYYLIKLLGKYQIPLITILALGAGSWAAWLFLSDTFTKFTDVQAKFSQQVADFQKNQIDSAGKVLEIQGKVVEKTTSVLVLIDDEVKKRRHAVEKQVEAEKTLSDKESIFRQMEINLNSQNSELKRTVERLNSATNDLKESIEKNRQKIQKIATLEIQINSERNKLFDLAREVIETLDKEGYISSEFKSIYNKSAGFITVDIESGKKWFKTFSKTGVGAKNQSSIIGITKKSLEEIAVSGVCDCSWHSFSDSLNKEKKYLLTKRQGDVTAALILSLSNEKLVFIERIENAILIDAFEPNNFVTPRLWFVTMDKKPSLLDANTVRGSGSHPTFQLVLSSLNAENKTIKNINPKYSYLTKPFSRMSVQDFLKQFPDIVNKEDGQYGFDRVLNVAAQASTYNESNLSSLNVYEMSQTSAKEVVIDFLVELGQLDWESASSFMIEGETIKDVGALSVGVHEPDFRLESVDESAKEKPDKPAKITYTFKYGLERRFADKGQTDVTMGFSLEKQVWQVERVLNYTVK